MLIFRRPSAHSLPSTGPGTAANVELALALGVDRIGHGWAMAADPRLMARAAKQGTTVEVCLTSNVKPGSSDGKPVDSNIERRARSSTAISASPPHQHYSQRRIACGRSLCARGARGRGILEKPPSATRTQRG